MSEPKAKERVLDAVRGLPEDATVEDAMGRLYFLAKVEEGLRDSPRCARLVAERLRPDGGL